MKLKTQKWRQLSNRPIISPFLHDFCPHLITIHKYLTPSIKPQTLHQWQPWLPPSSPPPPSPLKPQTLLLSFPVTPPPFSASIPNMHATTTTSFSARPCQHQHQHHHHHHRVLHHHPTIFSPSSSSPSGSPSCRARWPAGTWPTWSPTPTPTLSSWVRVPRGCRVPTSSARTLPWISPSLNSLLALVVALGSVVNSSLPW